MYDANINYSATIAELVKLKEKFYNECPDVVVKAGGLTAIISYLNELINKYKKLKKNQNDDENDILKNLDPELQKIIEDNYKRLHKKKKKKDSRQCSFQEDKRPSVTNQAKILMDKMKLENQGVTPNDTISLGDYTITFEEFKQEANKPEMHKKAKEIYKSVMDDINNIVEPKVQVFIVASDSLTELQNKINKELSERNINKILNSTMSVVTEPKVRYIASVYYRR